MKHKGVSVLKIAAGVFIGALLYTAFTNYLAQKQIQEFVETQQAQAARTLQKIEAQQAKRRAVELYKDTACGINENTGRCFCIHEKTGQKIFLLQDECKERAREITW